MKKDLTGQIFGNYTIISKVETPKNWGGQRYWKGICKYCNKLNNLRELFLGNLKISNECNCTTRQPDITNQKSGMLLAIKELKRSKGNIFWECLCDCGKIVYLTTSRFRRDNSCGCKRYIRGNGNKLWKGYGGISKDFFNTYARNAKKRKIKFNITIEDMWNLYLKQDKKCALTGVDIVIGRNKFEQTNASIDRIDSSKGYESNNIQWVDRDINYMKQSYSQDYFIQLCKNVVTHQQKGNV